MGEVVQHRKACSQCTTLLRTPPALPTCSKRCKGAECRPRLRVMRATSRGGAREAGPGCGRLRKAAGHSRRLHQRSEPVSKTWRRTHLAPIAGLVVVGLRHQNQPLYGHQHLHKGTIDSETQRRVPVKWRGQRRTSPWMNTGTCACERQAFGAGGMDTRGEEDSSNAGL